MPSREQIKKPVPHVSEKEAAALREKAAQEQAEVEQAQAKETNTSETDELMDEIDGLLEENEVLVNYRQKGGE